MARQSGTMFHAEIQAVRRVFARFDWLYWTQSRNGVIDRASVGFNYLTFLCGTSERRFARKALRKKPFCKVSQLNILNK
jgi:hypothetical protein